MRHEGLNILKDCIKVPLSSISGQESFSCGNIELDEYFHKECFYYEIEKFAKTYAFITSDEDKEIVSMFSICNFGINMLLLPSNARNKFQRKIHNSKRHKSYPALLIGRIGVNNRYKGFRIGSQVLDYIKYWFTYNTDSACRYVMVDAINDAGIIEFYRKNGFSILYSTEDDEKCIFKIPQSVRLKSRMMYCDLKQYYDIIEK